MNTPLSVLDENELESHKKKLANEKSTLLLNLTAKEQQLHTKRSFHPQITQNLVRELHHEIQKIDKEYKDISRLQAKYRHRVWKKKCCTKWSRFLACACFWDSHTDHPIDKGHFPFKLV